MSLITRIAIAASLIAMMAASAFAQTTLNGQLNWGDIVADINVVTRDGAHSAASVATAAGNSVAGANVNGGLDASSRQEMSGNTSATATLAGGDVRDGATMATAQANTLQAQATGGALALSTAQFAKGGDVEAHARADIRNARTLQAASSAALNNAATVAENGDLNVNLFQQATNSAKAVTDIDACCTGQTVAGGSAAINAWSSSSSTSTVKAAYEQESWAGSAEATTDVYQNRAYDATAATTAAANSASVANAWGYADVRGLQTSHTYVQAETYVTLPNFAGDVAVSSYGVGNTSLATNVGSDMVVDVAQLNTGGVAANAQFSGKSYDHGDAVLASTAIGNGFTGYVCSQCGDAALTGSVSQNNGGHIVSTGSIAANGAGAIIGSASAIGNSASFITTQKGN